jgi:hypothetical protein
MSALGLRRTIPARAALPAWCVCTALVVVAVVLHGVNRGSGAGLVSPIGSNLVFALWAVAYASVGAVIGARRSQNPVGWLLLAAGLVLALSGAAFEYADHGLVAGRSVPGSVAAAWIAFCISPAALALVALAVLLFPDGRPRSPAWRRAAWLPVATIVGLTIGTGLYPGPLDTEAHLAPNPLGLEGNATAVSVAQTAGWTLLVLSFMAAGAVVVLNLRGSDGLLRQQMKWVAGAGALAGVAWTWWSITFAVSLGDVVDWAGLVTVALSMCGIPVAIGIAVLRYRLYGIDVLIRRTVTYTALVAVLAGVYLGCVVVLEAALQSVSGQSGSIAVTLSTLAVAALFGPALRRIRHAVDRRFSRSAYDGAVTLAAFSGRLRHQIDLETVEGDLLGVVRETVQPAHATLWLRRGPAG